MLSRGAVRHICGGNLGARYGYGHKLFCSDGVSDALDAPVLSARERETAKEELDTGRTLAKLSLMVRGAKGAIKTAARERMLYPETQVRMEEEIKESEELISATLKKIDTENVDINSMSVDELADRIDPDKAIRIPSDALSYKELMRAEYLRDSFEDTMVSLNVLPPKQAWVDVSDKAWCRLDRREAKRKAAEEAAAAAAGTDDVIRAMEEDVFFKQQELPDAIERVSESELLKRKAEMESLSKIGSVLSGFDTALLEVKRVHKVHKGGTALSMRALVVLGDRKGTAGYGEGKSETTAHAVERACRDAKRNLLTLTRKDDRTIYHRVEGKYVKSKVVLWPAPPGTGISANNNFSAIFQLFGIRDVGAKLHGPRSLTNAVKALFNALSLVHTPESIAAARGLSVLELLQSNKPGVKRRQISQ